MTSIVGAAASVGAVLTCPACNGDGFLQFDGSVRETRTDVCTTCHGNKVVPANTGQTPESSAPSNTTERRHTRVVRSPED